jgi:hypothetical protein
MDMSADIFLNIDRVVVRGMNHIDRNTLAYALEQSLKQALKEYFFTKHNFSDTNVPVIQTNITLPTTANNDQLSESLAHGLIGTLGRSDPSQTTTAFTHTSAKDSAQDRGKQNA